MWNRIVAVSRTTGARVAAQMLVTALFVAFLIYRSYFAHFFKAVDYAEWIWLIVAVMPGCLALFSHATRWWLLLKRAGVISLRTATLIMLVAGFIGDFVPLRAGALFQLQVVYHRYGIPRAAVTGTLALEILLDVVVVAFFAIFVLPAAGLPVDWSIFLAVALGVVLAILIGVRFWDIALPAPLQNALDPLAAFWRDLSSGFGVLQSARLTVFVLLLTCANWLLASAGYYFLGRAFSMDVSPVAFLAMELAVNLVAKFSPSEGNIGTYELAAQQTLIRFGAPDESAAAFAVAAHLSAMFGTILLGIGAAWLLQLTRRDVFYV